MFAKATFPRDLSLDGLRVVVDAAHGAAYATAPLVFRELGADVHAVGVSTLAAGHKTLVPQLIAELKKLQESVPPMTADEVEGLLQETWGAGLDATFGSFERAPLAAAFAFTLWVAQRQSPRDRTRGPMFPLP